MLRTRVCDLLGVAMPILNAPMGGGPAGGPLAAAVSAGGGLGMVGANTEGGAEWLRQQVRSARAATDRPFGVGFISFRPGTAELMGVALDEGVRVVMHSFADVAPFVAPAHGAGAILVAQVQSVDGAARAAEAGADVIVAQGTEAGGHTGSVATLALVPAVVDAVAPLPVLAAGGIADGRGIAAALVLGADGVVMGTRFLATPEAGNRPGALERLLAARTGDTVLTEVFDLAKGMPWPPGILGRSVRNAFSDRWHGNEDALRSWSSEDRRAYRAAAADPDTGDLYAGDAVGLVGRAEPAADLVRRLAAEAEAVLRDRASVVLGA